ncbi:MAG: hypothetical protein QG599_915, partial [Pseudomonadota bacterium]|nr:hypothetical protein [Pseudomonadota bacterium]
MTVEWLDAWLWPEGEQMRWWTAADTRLLSRQNPARLLQQINSPSTPVRLHLTEDVPVETQRAIHEAVSARPLRDHWQVIFDVPRTAAPPVLPSNPNVAIADLWPDAEREDGQSPPLFKNLLNGLPNAAQWRGITEVQRKLACGGLSHRSLLVIMAHGSECHAAPPFRLADGQEWALPSDIHLPPLVLLLACGNADHNLVDYGRRLRKAGVQTVLAPTGRLDARPADRFLRDFLHGWQGGQRVDELLWRAQRQPDSEYGAGRLVILGRGDLRVGPALTPAEWPDAELQNAARALTPDSVP